MMHFAFTDEQQMIVEAASRFFAERSGSLHLHEIIDRKAGEDKALWQAAASELGLAGVALPEAHGGAGLGMVELAIVAEAAGYRIAPLPLLASAAMTSPALLAGGSPSQQAAWLPRLASGECCGSVALTGSEGDLDKPGIRLKDGRLSGAAHFVPHGALADIVLVAVEGGDMVLVESGASGVTIEPRISMDATRPYAVLHLDGVVGEPLESPAAARDAALRSGWIALAADALGGAQACLDQTVAFVQERVQFGRPIGSFQAVKHCLADMMVEIEQARSAVYWAACVHDDQADDALFAAHAAKAFATDTYALCAGHMIQLHGGIGFTWEHDSHLFFKRARADQALLGSPSWHREQIAQLVGLDEAA